LSKRKRKRKRNSFIESKDSTKVTKHRGERERKKIRRRSLFKKVTVYCKYTCCPFDKISYLSKKKRKKRRRFASLMPGPYPCFFGKNLDTPRTCM
jgi:hypothetical protein